MCSQPLRVKQRSRSAGVIAQQHVKFAPKIRVASSPHELSRQLLERRDQCFRNVAATEFAPVSVFVGLTCCSHRQHCRVAKRNISGFFTGISVQNWSEILRFAQNDTAWDDVRFDPCNERSAVRTAAMKSLIAS